LLEHAKKIKMKLLITLLLAVLLIQSNANPVVDCLLSCAKKHLNPFELAKLIGTCRKDQSCYLRELKGKAKECAQQCLSVAEVSSVEKVAAELYEELETQNIFTCFKDCAKKHLSLWEALRIVGTCKKDKNCYLRELKGKAKDCAVQCLSSSSDAVETNLVKMVDTTEEKNIIDCFKGCVRKHLTFSEAIRIIFNCQADKDCYLRELKGKALECVQECLGAKSASPSCPMTQEKSCEEHVQLIRKKFSELESREEKRALVEKVFNKLTEKYPNVDKKVVFGFVRALFSPLPAKAVCALYDKLFKKADDVDGLINDYEKNLGSCLKNCVKKHLSLTSALKLIAKCKVDKSCYLKNLGGKALDCVKQCI